MRLQSNILLTTAFAGSTIAYPPDLNQQSKCAPFSGDFTIKAYQLYPENADFDFNSCKLYIG
jgi:hypothetical protein